jgi:phosphoserine phosphatase
MLRLSRNAIVGTFAATFYKSSLGSRSTSGVSVLKAKEIFAKAQAVCFDVDSTVIMEEGIDVLAAYKGVGEAVSEMTRKAMGGNMKFEDALASRLEIIKPSKKDFSDCMEKHSFRLTPGVAELIHKLHERGTYVYLVSGGLRLMINPIAEVLKIPETRIFANRVIFCDKDEYANFDVNEPTSQDGGKAVVIQKLKNDHMYDPIVMIGDGATDMQARPPADCFIGFGGVAERQSVKDGADWYVHSFQELLDTLSPIASKE